LRGLASGAFRSKPVPVVNAADSVEPKSPAPDGGTFVAEDGPLASSRAQIPHADSELTFLSAT
jgi:hypothetical protein